MPVFPFPGCRLNMVASGGIPSPKGKVNIFFLILYSQFSFNFDMRPSFSRFIASTLLSIPLSFIPLSTFAVEIPSNYGETLAAAEKAKGSPEASLFQGRLAYLNYDFPQAEKLYEKYADSRKKSADGMELLGTFEKQLGIAKGCLDNVSKLRLISKKYVPFDNFINSIRLPRSAGRILPGDSIPEGLSSEIPLSIYSSEDGDYLLWAQNDSLFESSRLTDESWQTPEPLTGLGEGVSIPDYPFLRPDGASIYFASEGPDSMGGYDLFVAGRDTDTGEFLAPRNLGMPFNSPYDDYLVAIDDENGLAWLVSDREQRDGEVTVYLYMFEENRSNHSREDENLIAHARLTAPEDFEGEESPEAAGRLKSLSYSLTSSRASVREDFRFYLPGGKVLRRVEDFHSPAARVLAAKYRDALRDRERNKERLASLRSEYREAKVNKNADKMASLRDNILSLEKYLNRLEPEIRGLRSQICDLESL